MTDVSEVLHPVRAIFILCIHHVSSIFIADQSTRTTSTLLPAVMWLGLLPRTRDGKGCRAHSERNHFTFYVSAPYFSRDLIIPYKYTERWRGRNIDVWRHKHRQQFDLTHPALLSVPFIIYGPNVFNQKTVYANWLEILLIQCYFKMWYY
jgi:hypothetical protein